MRRADSLEKTLMLGKIEGRRRRGRQRMRWLNGIHRLYGHEFEQALGVGDGQGSLASCSPWGRKKSDTTERLNWSWKVLCTCPLLLLGSCCLVTKPCPTLGDPMDCNPPASSVRGIFQAIIWDWVAISFSRRSSWPRDWTLDSCISRRILIIELYLGIS